MRFLIIDDSITMRRIIANILNRLGYPEVVHASNGREALDRLATEAIDIVITDWYMPEMNGLDFVRALRTTPATSHIPIVIVTANAASDDIAEALELGVNSYILKPFTAETMREKIAALLTAAGETVREDNELSGNTRSETPAEVAVPDVTPEAAPVMVQTDTIEIDEQVEPDVTAEADTIEVAEAAAVA